ncbi:uncharacterized protein LOC128189375 [Crassostrea angulata]|uniref:uncharacterized protein LOC128189375 n=1 Tax=Magallana angulata TaxID=2784310 RepID=UPI0022B10E62|nr:uncharacterized protein LOC128189375 [Crassostrea angulata]
MLISIFFFVILQTTHGFVSFGHLFRPWTDTTNPNRTNLFCPSDCDKEVFIHRVKRCCRCGMKPVWELDLTDVELLNVEYRRRRGTAFIISIEHFMNYKYQILIHTYGFLSEIPGNVCDFGQKLVKLDLSQNAIKFLENTSCLKNLDTLVLARNKITQVKNETFSGLSMLRVLDLSNNVIKVLEPNTMSDTSLFLHSANFRQNQMQTIDITNFVLEKPFCKIDYSDNKMTDFTNEVSFQIDPNKIYGDGGYVDLADNEFQTWLNFTDLGFYDLNLIGKVLKYSFDFRGANWICDCKMQPFLEKVKPFLPTLWRDFFNITCKEPPELSGVSIADMAMKNKLDNFICNISVSSGCPLGCHCYEQPSERRTVVNCTGVGLTTMPSKLPAFSNIELLMKNNLIQELGDLEYLTQLKKIEINNNPLQRISSGLANRIKYNVDISLNCTNLEKIPNTFKQLDQHQVKLGICNITCDCSSKWVKEWISAKSDNFNHNELYCKASGGNIPIISFNFDALDCAVDQFLIYVAIGLASFLILLSVGTLVLYHYRYELVLILKNPTIGRENAVSLHYDIYIVVNENNNEALLWAKTVLTHKLKRLGYNTYFPCSDNILGDFKEELIVQMLSKSRDVIVLLTSEFKSGEEDLNTLYANLEWRHAWNNFKTNSNERNLIVINFDQLRAGDFDVSPLKAFLRLKMTLDFADKSHRLMEDLLARIGPPSRVNKRPLYKQTHRDHTQFIELYFW